MLDESGLARKAAAGDAAAFTALVRLHEAKVRRFLSRLTQGRGADDVAQEVFIKAWRMRGAWREEGSYGAWLMRIAWTSFLTSRRSDSRQQARELAAREFRDTHRPDVDLGIDIERALTGLGERERAAAMLCFAEGYSHEEAARILQLPLGSLKSIVARARARLIVALEA